ncbi:MAG: hypothetical protein JSU03_08250 [Bacteroidetes bacterium]|nr:hypothetical protein [Bacteroidota bacterium]MBS1757254.1 hypothetical protein [Bacteroidota bacterium]
MKKLLITLIFLSTTIVSFTQVVVRDHRSGSNCYPGQVSTKIEPNKWYYIKKAGTNNKYMQIAGHKNPTKSYAILAAEDLQMDNTSQQWRFVQCEERNVYRLQNRKYAGFLFTAPFEF